MPTLSPNAHTNAVFSELVRLATHLEDDQVARQILANSEVRRILPGLRSLCSAGEFELEGAWSRLIIASLDPQRELREFHYFANYEQLTRLEHHAVLGVTRCAPRRVLFVGAGPLPLTSLLLADRHGHTEIDNVDIDPEATRLAARLAEALHVSSLRFRCADVLACTDVADYDMVCLAAMVGPHPKDKTRVIKHLYRHMKPGALLLARSAHSLRTLLYPPLARSRPAPGGCARRFRGRWRFGRAARGGSSRGSGPAGPGPPGSGWCRRGSRIPRRRLRSPGPAFG